MWTTLRQIAGTALLVLLAASWAGALTLDRNIRQLGDRDPVKRAEAARALGVGACCRPVRSVPPLLLALNDPEWKVREAAAESLGYFSLAADQCVPYLLERLTDERVEVRRAIVLSLGRLRTDSEEVRQALNGFAGDPDAGIRTNLAITWTLLGQRDDSAIPLLVQALGSKNPPTSQAAATALKELAETEPRTTVSALVEALKAPDGRLATNAMQVLSDLRDQRDVALPEVCRVYDEVAPENRAPILKALTQMDETGDHALPVCIKGLADSDAAVRREALVGAMQYESRLDRHVAPIIACLKDREDENRRLTIEILRALGSRARDAIPSLIALTREGRVEVRVAAVLALADFKPPPQEVLEALHEALKDENANVQTAATETLAALKLHNPSGGTPVSGRAAGPEEQNRPPH